jgi:hypothetical protein
MLAERDSKLRRSAPITRTTKQTTLTFIVLCMLLLVHGALAAGEGITKTVGCFDVKTKNADGGFSVSCCLALNQMPGIGDIKVLAKLLDKEVCLTANLDNCEATKDSLAVLFDGKTMIVRHCNCCVCTVKNKRKHFRRSRMLLPLCAAQAFIYLLVTADLLAVMSVKNYS